METATLRCQKEDLKLRLKKAEAALNASEQREFELRNEEQKRIEKAVGLKIRSLELKQNAVESTRKRAQKDVQQLKAELSETHATFKQKLQTERDLRFRTVDELENLRATIQTMKKHNHIYARRTKTLEEENEHAVMKADAKAQQITAQLQQQLEEREEDIATHVESAREEREARFEAETKRRQAERIAKRSKNAASQATEELKSVKQKLDALQARLERATRGQRSALQSAKVAKEKNLMSLESTQKNLATKDTEINRLLASKKRAADSASTLRQELERRVHELEQRIDADRQAFQTERSQWTSLESDRDQAREQLARQVEIGERCRREVESSEESTRILQDQLAKEKLKRLDVERQIAQKSLHETESERSRVEMSMQLRARNKEMREIKHALESRGISLEFLIGKNIETVDSPVVVRSMTKSLRSLRDSAEAMSPSSDFASPPRGRVGSNSMATAVSPSQEDTAKSMEHVLSAPNSCDSPRNVGTPAGITTSLAHSTDSDKSSLGGSISVDASLSQWKKKVEGAASGALWGVRRQDNGRLSPPKKSHIATVATAAAANPRNSRKMNPAAAAAERRRKAALQTTTIKEL
jgi:hypothetical protein